MTKQQAIDSAPQGTSGLVATPWSKREPYGVAANWAQASAQVYALGEDGWEPNGAQVATYGHSPTDALTAELASAIRAGGDEPDDDEVAALVADAQEFWAAPGMEER